MADVYSNLTGGGPLRPKAPGTNPLEALQSLMGMQSISNVRSLDKRGLDLAQGYGDYEPSDVELLDAQQELGGSVSRDQLREGAMSHVKRQLAQGQQQHQYKMALEQQQQHREMAKQRVANEGSANVARIQTEGKAAQAEMAAQAKQAALDAMIQGFGGQNRSVSVSGVGSVGAERVAGAGTRSMPTDQMLKRLDERKQDYNGMHPVDAIFDRVPGLSALSGTQGRRDAYAAELEGILHRSGSMEVMPQVLAGLAQYPGNLAQKIAAAQADEAFNYDLTQLDPYEKEYLALRLGQ